MPIELKNVQLIGDELAMQWNVGAAIEEGATLVRIGTAIFGECSKLRRD